MFSTRSMTAPWNPLGIRTDGGVEPVTRRIGTDAGVMSPFRSNRKLPSRPLMTGVALSFSSTEARVPSECAIA
jgi:hypothetical protein